MPNKRIGPTSIGVVRSPPMLPVHGTCASTAGRNRLSHDWGGAALEMLANLNLVLAFMLELAMLAAFGYFGFRVTDHAFLRWMLALGLPLATAILWGAILAPKAARRLPMVPGILLSLGLLLLAALALYRSGQPVLAIVMSAAAIVHAVLAVLWGQW